MTRRLEWHSYGTPPIPNPYAATDPHSIPYKISPEEQYFAKLRKIEPKTLDIKKYKIPDNQVNFAHTIDPKVIKFFGWEDCASIITTYRNRNITTLRNILIDFFTRTQSENSISVKQIFDIFRWMTVTINNDPHIIAGTQEYTNHILTLNRNAEAINSWLIAIKYRIAMKQDQNWNISRWQVSEIIQSMMN